MDIKYVYVKARADFGKQCIFDVCGPNLDEEIKPNPHEMRNYIVKTPCHTGTQYTKQLAFHEVQTSAIKTKNSGMYHYEGGWPKEINPRDLETTARFRRRVEKDDEWVPKLRILLKDMEESILLNNTVDIHEHYFDDLIPTALTQERNIRLVNVFPDYHSPARPVNDISWSPDDTKMVVSYAPIDYQEAEENPIMYIWDLDSPNSPYMNITSPNPTLSCQFNTRDPFVLAGGLLSGQVCFWDVRTSVEPRRLSSPRYSHRNPTSSVKWISTKTNTEFFSSSRDGQVLWWDTRMLKQPIEQLIFDLDNPNDPSMENSIGIISANFEPSMSTKFMFGLQNGFIISGSRKVKTNAEKLALRFNAHTGPVLSVDRNSFNPKVFLSVGDSSTRIWSEDTREGSLMTIRSKRYLATGAYWNKMRHSLFYITRENGQLEVYDVLEGLENPIVELHLSNFSLTAMAPHENGYLLAVGDEKGNIYLTEATETLGKFERFERNILTAGFERSSKHVKAVDARVREMKLMKKLEAEVTPPPPDRAAKGKKKKQQVKIKEGEKPQKDDGKGTRDKSTARRSTARRKLKDDAPEILVAEEMFFDAVEKAREKLYSDEDQELRYSTFVRKFDPKQLRHRTAQEDEKAEDEEEDAKKKKKGKKKKIPAKATAAAPRGDEWRPEEEKPGVALEVLAETSGHEIVASSRRPRKGKKRKITDREEDDEGTKRKKERKKFPLHLRKPCKLVCQPKVCCWRKIWRTKDDGSKLGRKLRAPKRTEEKDEGSVQEIDDDEIKKGEGLPVELDRELVLARRELERSKKPIDWIQRKGLVARILKARMKPKERGKKRKGRRRKDRERVEEEEKQSDLPHICVKTRPSRAMDPCKLRGSWTFVKEIEPRLVPAEKGSTESEARLGKIQLEQLAAVQGRVYPRISDFTSTE